jgi:hypothetical protein
MSISDELSKLAELKEKGLLSPEEFEQGKKRILSGGSSPTPNRRSSPPQSYQFEDRSNDSVGKAANRYVSFQIIMAMIGIIIFLLFFAPIMCSKGSPFNSQPKIDFQPSFPK